MAPKLVVVTVPAYFGEEQRKATVTAATLAGFDVVELLEEPVAAALSYAVGEYTRAQRDGRRWLTKQRCLIFDFGGGTLDVTVMLLSQAKKKVLGISGHNSLGGQDIDALIVDDMVLRWNEWSRHTQGVVDLDVPQRERLRQHAITMKKRLSGSTSAKMPKDMSFGKGFEYKLTKTVFEQLCEEPVFSKILPVIDEALQLANLSANQIDFVLPVGGSSRIPRVVELLEEKFPALAKANMILKLQNPDRAVAEGAAIHAFSKVNADALTEAAAHLKQARVANGVGTSGSSLVEFLAKPTYRIASHSLGVRIGTCGIGGAGSGFFEPSVRNRKGCVNCPFRVSLLWLTDDDLDLHVTTPSGRKIWRAKNKSRCGGLLDVESDVGISLANPDQGIEHIAWGHSIWGPEVPTAAGSFGGPAEVNVGHPGEYTIDVVLNKRVTKGAIPWFVEVVDVLNPGCDCLKSFNGTFGVNKPSDEPFGVSKPSDEPQTSQRVAVHTRSQGGRNGKQSILDLLHKRDTCDTNVKLIPRGTVLPASEQQLFSNSRDNQETVMISILEGESASATDARTLKDITLEDLPKKPRGELALNVTFSLSADGVLSVSAECEGGSSAHVRVSNLDHEPDEILEGRAEVMGCNDAGFARVPARDGACSEADGLKFVTQKTECVEAAVSFNLKADAVEDLNDPSAPFGCFFSENADVVHFNPVGDRAVSDDLGLLLCMCPQLSQHAETDHDEL